MEIIAWIQTNWVAVSAILLAVLRLAESIAVVTKTDADNKIIASIKEFFKFN